MSRPSGVCRRLPPQYAPFPPSARRAASARTRIARHRTALHAPGRGDRATRSPAATSSSSRRPRPARRSATTCRSCTPILQDPSSRALYLFPTKALAQDQLAELQAICEPIGERVGRRGRRVHVRRRHAAGRAADDPHARAPRAQQSRHGALGHPAAPSAMGQAASRTCATSSSTSCTPIAACSAAICATCCGDCGASAATTARTRCSSARRRRSRIRASWPNG